MLFLTVKTGNVLSEKLTHFSGFWQDQNGPRKIQSIDHSTHDFYNSSTNASNSFNRCSNTAIASSI